MNSTGRLWVVPSVVLCRVRLYPLLASWATQVMDLVILGGKFGSDLLMSLHLSDSGGVLGKTVGSLCMMSVVTISLV